MRYIGDDLINLMTVTISPKEAGQELPEIETVEIKIGCLHKKYSNVPNPFTIDVMRDESIKLSINNRCFAAIWYWKTINGERKLLKKTCEGTMTLALKPEVINDGRCKC